MKGGVGVYLCPCPKKIEFGGGMLCFPVGALPDIERRECARLSKKESYCLTVDENGVLIEGADDSGIYYGELTLKQLMLNYRGCLPYLTVYDEPEYSYRGFMIDSCRHFFSVDEIKKMIDAAAYFKFNKFHFHLSDDQGFRVEIESYPLLTSVGSVRSSSNFGNDEKDETQYSGYYTKSELKDIVEYCRERHIEVIPEFDVPGHTTAVLASYPEFSCTGKKIEPKTTGGIFKDILCVGNPDTLDMVYSVIDELCEIFDGEYFHIGGDEAPKKRWLECPKCNAKLRELGLNDMAQLQGWLANEINGYLKKKGKKSICWNEALRGDNLDSDITVSLWMDRTDKSVKWANSGNSIIVENFTPYYVDYPYGMHSLKSVYKFNPRKMRGLTPDGAKSIIGIESPIWTEHIRDFSKMTYMCFPRWLAVAQTAWSGTQSQPYSEFVKNAEFYCDVLKGMGVIPAPKKDWDVAPHKKIGQTVSFFINSISTLKQFFED